MMKAEIANEITRSRNQTASTGIRRGEVFPGAELFQDVLGDPGDAIPDFDCITELFDL